MASSRLSCLREKWMPLESAISPGEVPCQHCVDIDIESIAWHEGNLRVRVGGLTSREGRLVTTHQGGIIRVASKRN